MSTATEGQENASASAPRYAAITIGASAGHRFIGRGDLRVSYHAERRYPDGLVERGYLVRRKWLANRSAFDYDPTMGWATEHWFEWSV